MRFIASILSVQVLALLCSCRPKLPDGFVYADGRAGRSAIYESRENGYEVVAPRIVWYESKGSLIYGLIDPVISIDRKPIAKGYFVFDSDLRDCRYGLTLEELKTAVGGSKDAEIKMK